MNGAWRAKASECIERNSGRKEVKKRKEKKEFARKCSLSVEWTSTRNEHDIKGRRRDGETERRKACTQRSGTRNEGRFIKH
jgi:hypothetical protein